MCKRSNYTQNAHQYEGDCEYRITSNNNNNSPLEGKYSEHGSSHGGERWALAEFVCVTE